MESGWRKNEEWSAFFVVILYYTFRPVPIRPDAVGSFFLLFPCYRFIWKLP